MATTTGTPSRIHLKGKETARIDEADAAGVISPGQLIRLNVDGDVIPHDIAYGGAERAFAVEDALQGRGIETDYASGEKVSYILAAPGDEVYAWLAFGESVVVGDYLGSDGFGNLAINAESGLHQTGQTLAVAIEALDNSESDDNNARIKVRVL
jgi:hypothetical protein